MLRFQMHVDIDAPTRAVWDVLAEFCALTSWAPFISECWGTKHEELGVGYRRWIRLMWGFTLEETILEWEEGERYALLVVDPPFPLKDFHERWEVLPHEDGTRVQVSVLYGIRWGLVGWLADVLWMRLLLKLHMWSGLRGLRRLVEYEAPRAAARSGRAGED